MRPKTPTKPKQKEQMSPETARELLCKLATQGDDDGEGITIVFLTDDAEKSYIGTGSGPTWRQRPMTREEHTEYKAWHEQHPYDRHAKGLPTTADPTASTESEQ